MYAGYRCLCSFDTVIAIVIVTLCYCYLQEVAFGPQLTDLFSLLKCKSMKPKVLAFQRQYGNENESLSHMIAASMGESAACLVRVPTEVLKAKMQTSAEGAHSLSSTFRLVLAETHGSFLSNLTGGLYRGYGITLLREVPFAAIQFPMYEWLKVTWGNSQGSPAGPVQAAACGSFSGAIAAACTTPLDVLKTRLMIGVDKQGVPYRNAVDVLKRTVAEEGTGALLSGIQPRVFWISLGGFVFFGAYETARTMITPILG